MSEPGLSKDEQQTPAPARRRSAFHIPKPVWVLVLFAALAVAAYFGQKLVKLLGPPERCWELKDEDGKIYKLNPCTGQFRLLGDAPPPDARK